MVKLWNSILKFIETSDLDVYKKDKQNLIDGCIYALKQYPKDESIIMLDKININILYN